MKRITIFVRGVTYTQDMPEDVAKNWVAWIRAASRPRKKQFWLFGRRVFWFWKGEDQKNGIKYEAEFRPESIDGYIMSDVVSTSPSKLEVMQERVVDALEKLTEQESEGDEWKDEE
jgi:hypothetical protein